MPVESAQYINTLQPDWPLGTDPESAGDDHLRMIKQVLQNTFPAMSGAVNLNDAEANNLHIGWQHSPVDPNVANSMEYWKARNQANDGTMSAIMCQGPTKVQAQANTNLVMTYSAIANMFYPVGAVVIFADSQNPHDKFGFGTWEAVSGMIAGAGDVKDSSGYSMNILAGNHNSAGHWRVWVDHIVERALDVSLTGKAESAGGHEHDSNMHQGNIGSTAGGGTNYPSYGDSNFKTGEAGDHEHDVNVSGQIEIGTGTTTTGSAFVNPYYGLYVWRRTA